MMRINCELAFNGSKKAVKNFVSSQFDVGSDGKAFSLKNTDGADGELSEFLDQPHSVVVNSKSITIRTEEDGIDDWWVDPLFKILSDSGMTDIKLSFAEYGGEFAGYIAVADGQKIDEYFEQGDDLELISADMKTVLESWNQMAYLWTDDHFGLFRDFVLKNHKKIHIWKMVGGKLNLSDVNVSDYHECMQFVISNELLVEITSKAITTVYFDLIYGGEVLRAEKPVRGFIFENDSVSVLYDDYFQIKFSMYGLSVCQKGA